MGPRFANVFINSEKSDIHGEDLKCIIKCAGNVIKLAPCIATAVATKNPLALLNCGISKGKVCDGSHISERDLVAQLAEPLKHFKIDAPTLAKIKSALRESSAGERAYNTGRVTALRTEETRLRTWIEKAYADRLDELLTVDEYRAKWNLQSDHPMTAPGYSERRSTMAKQLGLGRGGRGASVEGSGPAASEVQPRRRGRPRSTAASA